MGINKCLHEKINELFAGTTMGQELAVALFCTFLFQKFLKTE